MISSDRTQQALAALNWVIVITRLMGYERAPHETIARVMDTAEYLVLLIADPVDQTAAFRAHLDDLLRLSPQFQLAIDRFDNPTLAWPWG